MNYATTYDLRDIAFDWRIASDWRMETEWTEDDPEVGIIEKYAALCDQLGVPATPEDLEAWANDYEPTIILQSTFKEYAQELAEEMGRHLSPGWPYTCIDWEWAARELAHDYTSISYDGQDFYIRSV